MVTSSAAEVFSLAAVLPFLAVLANPEQMWQLPVVQQIAAVLQITAADQLLRPVTLLFGIAAISAAAIRLLNVRLNGRVAAVARLLLQLGGMLLDLKGIIPRELQYLSL